MAETRSEQPFGTGAVVTGMAMLVYMFLILPSFIIIPVSFGNRTELVFPPAQYTLDLYRDYFGSAEWVDVTFRSARIAFMAAALALLVGAPGAYALSRTEFPGKRLLVTILLSPILVPIVVISLGIYLYYSRISLTGTTVGIVLAHAMYVTPFVMITLAAGIDQLDERLETASTIMGASRLRTFVHIVLPQLTPSLVAAALFAFLMSFDEVVIAWFITGPSTMTLPVKMYASIRWETSPVLAAVATILTLISIAICLIGVCLTRVRTRNRQGN
jgi:putative spermidine/putrescine transport system permease protein